MDIPGDMAVRPNAADPDEATVFGNFLTSSSPNFRYHHIRADVLGVDVVDALRPLL